MLTELLGIDGAGMKSVDQHTDEHSVTQHSSKVLQLACRFGGRMLRSQDMTANQPFGTQPPVISHDCNISPIICRQLKYSDKFTAIRVFKKNEIKCRDLSK